VKSASNRQAVDRLDDVIAKNGETAEAAKQADVALNGRE
jgi:hypothetical protein